MNQRDELDNINKLVTNEEQARRASIIKWSHVAELLSNLDTLANRKCGFCALGQYRLKTLGSKRVWGDWCDHCPSDVNALCRSIDGKISTQLDEIENIILSVTKFLEEDFKVTDGSGDEN